MAEKDPPWWRAFVAVVGTETAEKVKELQGKNSINSVERERRHRQRVVDAERLREAEEIERRKLADK